VHNIKKIYARIMARGVNLMDWQGNYRHRIISFKEQGYSSNPGEDMEGEKLRLPGDLVAAKVREGIPGH